MDLSQAQTIEELTLLWKETLEQCDPSEIPQINAEYSALKRALLNRNKHLNIVCNTLKPIEIKEQIGLSQSLHIYLQGDILHFDLQMPSIAPKTTSVPQPKGNFTIQETKSGLCHSF